MGVREINFQNMPFYTAFPWWCVYKGLDFVRLQYGEKVNTWAKCLTPLVAAFLQA